MKNKDESKSDRKLDAGKIMDRIAKASEQVVSGVKDEEVENWVTIYVMGRAYKVPADLTILTAIEYAGYKFLRGCGCRQGFCGACSTVYRKKGEYKLQTGMACQTRVEDGMFLVQIPFTPAEKASYDIGKLNYNVNSLFQYYPELARCVSCNTCTKACPQDLEVMDYVQAGIKGDFKELTEKSFDCIQCGLCAIRCPSELVQYNISQLGRRLYGRYDSPEPAHLKKRLQEIQEGKFNKVMERITGISKEEMEKMYAEREREVTEEEKFRGGD